MHELVGNRREDLPVTGLRDEIIFPDRDVRRIQVFDTIRRLGLNFEKEGVLLVWKLSKESHRSVNNVLNIGTHLRRTHRNSCLAEDQVVTCAACFELQHLEVSTDKGRRIDECVVVGGLVTIAFLFQTGVHLPSARRVEFHTAWHVLLTNDIHEDSGWREVGHLIRQRCRIDLVAYVGIVRALLRDAPCLFVCLFPVQRLIANIRGMEALHIARVVFDAIHTGRPRGH